MAGKRRGERGNDRKYSKYARCPANYLLTGLGALSARTVGARRALSGKLRVQGTTHTSLEHKSYFLMNLQLY